MLTAILKESGGFYFSDRNMPQISEDEVMIKVHICGVCTSDLGAWRNGLGQELVLGHEVVGEVCRTGASVKDFTVGDRVTGSIPNGYSEFTKTKASNLIKLPETLADAGGLVEPIVCLLSGIERVGPVRDRRIAVIGAGYMGLNLIRLLKVMGCGELTAIDPKLSAHDRMKEAGADVVLASADDAGAYPIVFEVSGAAPAIKMSARLCEQYGKLVMVGYHPYPCEIDLALWASKALEVIMSFEYRHEKQLEYMRKAILMTQSGDLMGEKLFTHSYGFAELDTAFKESSLKKDGFIKAFVTISK